MFDLHTIATTSAPSGASYSSEPEAIIGPLGATKSVPRCILLYPKIGCFLIPKDDDKRAR